MRRLHPRWRVRFLRTIGKLVAQHRRRPFVSYGLLDAAGVHRIIRRGFNSHYPWMAVLSRPTVSLDGIRMGHDASLSQVSTVLPSHPDALFILTDSSKVPS